MVIPVPVVQSVEKPEALPCETMRRRVRVDKQRGRTTSQAALDFIWRTCGCEHCAARRKSSARSTVRGAGR